MIIFGSLEKECFFILWEDLAPEQEEAPVPYFP